MFHNTNSLSASARRRSTTGGSHHTAFKSHGLAVRPFVGLAVRTFVFNLFSDLQQIVLVYCKKPCGLLGAGCTIIDDDDAATTACCFHQQQQQQQQQQQRDWKAYTFLPRQAAGGHSTPFFWFFHTKDFLFGILDGQKNNIVAA
jgi:hypothetical protein